MLIQRPSVVVLLLGTICGCTVRPGPGPLAPDVHYQASPSGTDEARHVLVDRPEKMYDAVTVDVMNPNFDIVPQEPKPETESVTTVSSTAAEAAHKQLAIPVKSPATAPATAPTTAPVTNAPQRVWIELGGVVVQVNGRPIFAGEVIKPLMPLLQAEAKRHDADGYRIMATKAIRDQLTSMIRNELLVAQAEQVLDQKEQDLAWQMTMMWQQEQIRAAGGSIEQAKSRAAADGIPFDELLQEKLRENKVMIYYQKKLVPRLQVTAQDIREYYQKHLKDMFSESEHVQFRLIKVAIRQAGRDDALKKITDLQARLKKGEDFQTLATQFNDDSRLAKNGGLEQPIARGAYVNEKVEAVAWSLEPGKFSEIIETPGAFYLIKLESRKDGRVQPFEDLAVQRQIGEILRKEQFAAIIEKEQTKLLANQPIFPDPPRYELVVEMAMQLYPQWLAAK